LRANDTSRESGEDFSGEVSDSALEKEWAGAEHARASVARGERRDCAPVLAGASLEEDDEAVRGHGASVRAV
jgi:hypothetical protein